LQNIMGSGSTSGTGVVEPELSVDLQRLDRQW
jgi:hypothetical protein